MQPVWPAAVGQVKVTEVTQRRKIFKNRGEHLLRISEFTALKKRSQCIFAVVCSVKPVEVADIYLVTFLQKPWMSSFPSD